MLETCAFKPDEPKYFPGSDAFNSQKKTYAIDNNQLLERIILNPKVMVGKPIIRGTRLTVQYILGLLAHGASVTEILGEYEGLSQERIPIFTVKLSTTNYVDKRIQHDDF